jgi:hypothetical protein
MTDPQYLWFLALLPLYWYLQQKEQQQETECSTFFLWDQVFQTPPTLSSPQKKSFPLLATLAWICFVSALASPLVPLPQSPAPFCFFIDFSLSMATQEEKRGGAGSQSRLEKAQEWLAQESQDSDLFFCFPLLSVSKKNTELPKNCTSLPLNRQDILEAVNRCKREYPHSPLFWISDQAWDPDSSSPTPFSAQILFGQESSENASIAVAQVRSFSASNELFLLLRNESQKPLKRQLSIQQGTFRFSEEILLPASKQDPPPQRKAGELQKVIPFPSQPELLHIRLSPSDELAEDDHAYLNPQTPYRIYLSEPLQFLAPFLERFPFFQMAKSPKESHLALSTTPEKEAFWTVLFPPSSQSPPLNLLQGAWKPLNKSHRIQWQSQDPLLEGISFWEKNLASSFSFLPQDPAFQSLVESDSQAVLGEHPQQRWSVWGFSLDPDLQELELGFYLCNLLEREFLGSPLHSHFMQQTSLKYGISSGKHEALLAPFSEKQTLWLSALHLEESKNDGKSLLPSLDFKRERKDPHPPFSCSSPLRTRRLLFCHSMVLRSALFSPS